MAMGWTHRREHTPSDITDWTGLHINDDQAFSAAQSGIGSVSRDQERAKASRNSRNTFAKALGAKCALRPLGFGKTQTNVFPMRSAWAPNLASGRSKATR